MLAALVFVVLASPLAPLLDLFGTRESCVWRETGQPPFKFTSESRMSPDDLFLIQRNFNASFSEIIIYTFSQPTKRFVRTQLNDAGKYAVATSPGPQDGWWTFTNQPTQLRHDSESITLRATAKGETDHNPGKPGIGTCTKV